MDCHKCGKKGHLAGVCRSQEQKQTRRWGKQSTNLLSDTVEPDKELEDMLYPIQFEGRLCSAFQNIGGDQ